MDQGVLVRESKSSETVLRRKNCKPLVIARHFGLYRYCNPELLGRESDSGLCGATYKTNVFYGIVK